MSAIHVVLCCMMAASLQCQASLSLVFRSHGGETLPLSAIPAIQTGDLSGTLFVPEGGPSNIWMRWAYFAGGGIVAGSDGSSPLSYARSKGILNSDSDVTGPGSAAAYSVSIPIGYCDGTVYASHLLVGEYELRVWFVQDYDPVGANPPTSYLYAFQYACACVAPEVVVWINSSRNLTSGEVTTGRIVMEAAASEDTYFELECSGDLLTSQSIVVVPRGFYSTPEFVIEVGENPGSGAIVATRLADGVAFKSSTTLSSLSLGAPDPAPTVEFITDNKYCKSPTLPTTGSGDTVVCGKCSPLGGTPALPPACSMYNGQVGLCLPVCYKYHCATYPGSKCRVIRAVIPMKHWKLVSPYRNETCYELKDISAEGGGSIELVKIGKISTNNPSSVTVTGASIKRCCDREYVGTLSIVTATCETVIQ